MFRDYADHHRSPGNKWCHRLGIPLIMLSLFGMLSILRIPLGALFIDAAILLIAIGTIYYFWLGIRFGVAMLIVSILLYLIGTSLPLFVNVALFIVGWLLQFIGHGVYEKRSPAFVRNFIHLLVGPMWIVNDVVPLMPGSQRIENGGR